MDIHREPAHYMTGGVQYSKSMSQCLSLLVERQQRNNFSSLVSSALPPLSTFSSLGVDDAT